MLCQFQMFSVVKAASIEGGIYVEFADVKWASTPEAFSGRIFSFAKQLDHLPLLDD